MAIVATEFIWQSRYPFRAIYFYSSVFISPRKRKTLLPFHLFTLIVACGHDRKVRFSIAVFLPAIDSLLSGISWLQYCHYYVTATTWRDAYLSQTWKREFMINEKYQMTLDDTLVLRSISILIIILHNYIHRFSNVVLENQHVYYPERNKELIDSFLEFDSGLLWIWFPTMGIMEYRYSFFKVDMVWSWNMRKRGLLKISEVYEEACRQTLAASVTGSCMLGINQDFPCLSILGYTFLNILFAWEYERLLLWCKNRIVFKQRE